MKADFSMTDLIHLQVANRLTGLLFEELEKLNIADAPLTAQRVHLAALKHAQAVQESILDLLRGVPGDISASPEHN